MIRRHGRASGPRSRYLDMPVSREGAVCYHLRSFKRPAHTTPETDELA